MPQHTTPNLHEDHTKSGSVRVSVASQNVKNIASGSSVLFRESRIDGLGKITKLHLCEKLCADEIKSTIRTPLVSPGKSNFISPESPRANQGFTDKQS